jgi:hypothetical protein
MLLSGILWVNWYVSSVRQAFKSYLYGPLNGETIPQPTGGAQPLVLNNNVLQVYFDL